MTHRTVSDYGFLSDCQSAALVSRDGSIDWWCLPRFDSPSGFARLLDDDAGHWSVRPTAHFDVERGSVGDSLVLRTVFQTESGSVAVTDALALEPGVRVHDIGRASPHVLVRQVTGVTGEVEIETVLAPSLRVRALGAPLHPAGRQAAGSGGSRRARAHLGPRRRARGRIGARPSHRGRG